MKVCTGRIGGELDKKWWPRKIGRGSGQRLGLRERAPWRGSFLFGEGLPALSIPEMMWSAQTQVEVGGLQSAGRSPPNGSRTALTHAVGGRLLCRKGLLILKWVFSLRKNTNRRGLGSVRGGTARSHHHQDL